jgi:type II secretory pathway pseudopilin PulG
MNGTKRGFTIIEAIAAFTIVVLSLRVLVRSIGLSARSEKNIELTLFASASAQNHLARLGNDTSLGVGTRTGAFHVDLNWTETIEYFYQDEPNRIGLRAVRVTLDVKQTSSQRTLTIIRTVKLINALTTQ